MEGSRKSQFSAILNGFLAGVTGRVNQVANRSVQISFPVMSPENVKFLCAQVKEIIMNEPSMLEIPPDVVIVGDIHGHVLDLIRIFDTFGLPDKQRYLFLGDIVDRGEFSIESIIIIFLCKYLFPDNFFIIRGNHEFLQMCSNLGFSRQIANVYNDSTIFDAFIECFSFLPLSALIGTSFFCVHGGIGPSHNFLQQFKELKRPIVDFSDMFLEDIVWSDPYLNVNFFEKSSIRGYGYLFGKDATEEFLKQNKLKLLIRAHECVSGGYCYMHDGMVVTVFSASNYCGCCNNNSAVLVVKGDDVSPHIFRALNYLKREDVIYKSSVKLANKGIRKIFMTESTRNLPRFKITEPTDRPPNTPNTPGATPRRPKAPRRKSYA